MGFASLRRLLAGKIRSPKAQKKKVGSQRRRITPILEHLESRIVLSNSYTVAAGDTTGLISAINSANTDTKNNITGDTITLTNLSTNPYNFSATNNTTNGNNVLPIITATGLTIQGSGATLNAGANGRLFDVASGASVTLVDMTLTGGKVSGTAAKGGAVYNTGSLKMTSVQVYGNSAAGGSNQNAAGGGIYSNGSSLTLINDLIGREEKRTYTRTFSLKTFTSKVNHSTKTIGASNKAAGGTGASGQGGGLYVAGGTVNITNCTIGDNQLSGGASAQGGGIYANGVTKINLTNTVIGRESVHKSIIQPPGATSSAATAFTTSSKTIGSANKVTGGSAMGAGLYVSGGVVSVSGGAIAGNQAQAGAGQSAAGGGVYSVGASSLTFINVAFLDNHVFGGVGTAAVGSSGGNAQGGGLWVSGGNVNLSKCQVTDQGSYGVGGGNGGIGGNGGNAQGGGIYAINATLTLTDSHVDRNALAAGLGGSGTKHHQTGGQGGTAQGGGVYASNSTITIGAGSSIFNNFAGAGHGGTGEHGLLGKYATTKTSKQSGGTAGGAGGNGGLAQGGGLYANGGSVTVSGNNISITFNEAEGGSGGTGGNGGVGVKPAQAGGVGGTGGAGGEGDGGGIYVNNAPLTVSGGVTFDTNLAVAGVGGQGGVGGWGFVQNLGTRGTKVSSYGGSGGVGGIGGGGGEAQGGGVFAIGSGLSISLGAASGGLIMNKNQANAGHGAGGGAGGGVDYSYKYGVLQTPKYIMGQGGNSGNGGAAIGGAVAVYGDKLTLTNAALQTNGVQGGGGGANRGDYLTTPYGSIPLGGAGGAAGGAGGSGQGGGLFVSGSSAVLILNSTLSDNTANIDDQAAFGFDGANGGKGGYGGKKNDLTYKSGGLGYLQHGGNGGNGGIQQGAGLYAASSTLSVLNSTIADNALYDSLGGAGGSGTQGNGTAGANGWSQGSGVFATGGSLSLTNDTIAWNFINPVVNPTPSADAGAGVYNDASNALALQNTIVALDQIYNAVPPPPPPATSSPISTPSDLYGAAATTSDHNLIGDGTGSSGLTNNTNGNQVGSDAAPIDPKFSAPAPTQAGHGQEPGNYGGPTPTLALYGNSPAIAAGNTAAASTIAADEGVASGNATDQRGLPRVVNNAIDIGATEMQVILTGNPSVTTTQVGGTITYTVNVTNGEGVPANLTLTDVVPTNTTYVSGSASGTGWTITQPSATNSNTLTATMTLNPGATATLTFSVTVGSGAANTTINDTANLSWTGTNTSGSTSVTMSTSVTGGMVSTTTTLNPLPNPSVYGQSVAFTATVSASSGTPTGEVVFEDGSTILGKAALNNGVATFTTAALSVGNHSITAVYSGDANDFGSTSNTVTQVVNQDSTTTTLALSPNPSVYGQIVTFTASVKVNGPGSGTPTGTVAFYDGTTKLGTALLNNNGVAAFSFAKLPVGNDSITAHYCGDTNDKGSTSNGITQIVDQDSTTTALTSSASSSPFGQSVTFTATVSANSPGTITPTGSVDFVDTTTGVDLGTVALSNGTASLTVSNLEPGSHVIKATYTDSTGSFLGSSATVTQTSTQSIIVLDAADAGALRLSGSSSINVAGNVIVDSKSQTALTESGSTSITAKSIQVVGGVSTSSTATLSPAAVTGISPVANPLAYLTGPSTSGLTNYGAVQLSSGSETLNPGIYTSIKASGTASLTLNPGIYLIEGGGLTVTGSASISGSGVMLYNTSSNYPSSTGTYGGITLSGNGTFALSAPTSGIYNGIVIFQPSANTRAISLSGNAADGLGGTIYAQAALLFVSGNAKVNGALVVNQLALSGSAASSQNAAGSNADNIGSTAGELLAGNVEVYVDNSNGDLTADELARIQDAVNAVDAVTAPYGVTVAEVSDPTLANVTLSMGTSSVVGGYAQGVLGCYTTTGQITLIQGWNWYAGSDPTLIGATQYDFQTTVTHELGHALGLGESNVTTSAMYGTLSPGTVIRTLTTADLNIPYAESGADAQMAAVPLVPASTISLIGNSPVTVSNMAPPSIPSVSGSGSSLSVVDQVFADIALVLSDVRNAYQFEVSSMSALRQQADALALQFFDVLMSFQAGAMGLSQDTLIRTVLSGGR
jgi:uncharacterized repeat protein (TIGR01451 family)